MNFTNDKNKDPIKIAFLSINTYLKAINKFLFFIKKKKVRV